MTEEDPYAMVKAANDPPYGYRRVYLAGTAALVHERCGSLVGDINIHEAWHDDLDYFINQGSTYHA